MTKILAIDDSKTMRLAIKITFAAEQAEVVAVSKGSEAVARAKQMGANIVLVDHTLAPSEPAGFDVVKALKADPATASTPVLMLVPAKGGIDEAQVQAAGADGFIGKPFDSQELIDKVGALIGRGAGASAAPVQSAPAAAAKPAAAAAAPAKPAAAPPPGRAPAAPPPGRAAAAPPPGRAGVPPLGRSPGAAPAKPAAAPAKPAAAPAKPAMPPLGQKPAAAPAKPAAAKPAVPPLGGGRPPSGPGPAATPAARPPSGPAATPSSGGAIPIAVPIPFAPAGAPTSSMLERLEASGGGAAAGLDPAAVQALLSLSREVVERVVWEVVPELAEQMIREKNG